MGNGRLWGGGLEEEEWAEVNDLLNCAVPLQPSAGINTSPVLDTVLDVTEGWTAPLGSYILVEGEINKHTGR